MQNLALNNTQHSIFNIEGIYTLPSSDNKQTANTDTNDPALPDSPDRSDLAGAASGWGGTKLSVRGLPFR